MNNKILNLHNIYMLFFSFLCVLFGLLLNQTIYPVALYSALMIIVYIIFLYGYSLTVKLQTLPFLLILLFASSFLKVISVLILENIMIDKIGVPFLSYKDDYIYDLSSSNILEVWKVRGIGFYQDVDFSTGFYSGYPNFSAFAKYIFGDYYLVPRFMNVLFSALTIKVYFDTVGFITDSKEIKKITTILLAFSPVFIVYSSLQLKDTLLIFFLSTLIYGTISFYKKGINIKNTLIVVFSMIALMFFRAAVLLPYFVALMVSSVIVRKDISTKSNILKSLIWTSFIFIGFYIAWTYLYDASILALTSGEYVQSRFESRGNINSYSGTNDLGKIGIIGVLLGPLFAFLSLFLPAPVYINLDELSNLIPYHYLPLLEYYSILPIVVISLIYIIKNRNYNKIGLFVVLFLVLYKIGQSGDKSILDSRQSLPAIYAAYVLLPFFNYKNNEIALLTERYKYFIIVLMIVVLFSVTFLRYLIR